MTFTKTSKLFVVHRTNEPKYVSLVNCHFDGSFLIRAYDREEAITLVKTHLRERGLRGRFTADRISEGQDYGILYEWWRKNPDRRERDE